MKKIKQLKQFVFIALLASVFTFGVGPPPADSLSYLFISEPDGSPSNEPAYKLTFPNGTVSGSAGSLVIDPSMGAATEIQDDAYSAAWNADTGHGASQNALYDYLVNFDADADGSFTDEAWFPVIPPDITFDIGDDGGDDSTAVAEIATTGDTNSIFTEPSADKILIDLTNNWPTCDVAVQAQTGDSATSFFSAGTIEHERGGLEADVSAYDGLIGITGGATVNIQDEATFYGFLSDVSQFYEPGDTLQTGAGLTLPATCTVGEMYLDTDADTNGSLYTCVSTNTWKEVDDDGAGGGGSAITLDLADDASNESIDLQEIATSGDTNSIFTEPSADKLLIDVSQNWPSCDSATTATTATTANAGDSATAFFSSGTVEEAYIDAAIARDTELPTQASLSVDDLITLSGVVEGSTHLGTFTGTTITDNQTIKAGMQELETAVELAVGGGVDTNGTVNADEIAVFYDLDTLKALTEAEFKTAYNMEAGVDFQAYDADLTTYAGITPSANVQSYLGAADYAAMRTQLGLVIGTNVQAYDADLTTYAGITPSANVQSYLGAADYAAMRTQLGLVIGTNVQAYNANLTTWIQERTISTPADADDYYWFKAPSALTLSNLDCIAQGTTPSITVDLQECDSSGASCTTVLSAPVTCNGGNDAATISDSSIASGAWLYVALGAPSGTVTAVSFTLKGTK